MDIRVERGMTDSGINFFETYANEQLEKYFDSYPFIESAHVYFRGKNHSYKKVKLHLRLKGKDIYAEATGHKHDVALDNAIDKIRPQMEKYKSKHYVRA